MKKTNRDKVLAESIELFNRLGAASTTTNHICRSLGISPGNLYFHFRNKEEVVYALFELMCEETNAHWKRSIADGQVSAPLKFVADSLDIFWKYRFFHREMYHLRRQDPRLNERWHRHLDQTRRFMRSIYSRWIKNKLMVKVRDLKEAKMIGDIVMVTASSFFQFYESIEKPATERPLRMAKQHTEYFLSRYLIGLRS